MHRAPRTAASPGNLQPVRAQNPEPDFRPLIVHIVFRLDYGGLENGVVNLVNVLTGRSFDHAVIALTECTQFARRLDSRVPVHVIGKRPGKDLAAYLRVWRLLRRLRPAAVHTRNLGTLDCSLVALLAGVPVRIHSEHGWEINDPDGKSRKGRLLRRIFSRCVQRFVAVSDELRTWLVTSVGIPDEKITVIRNGVDTHRFQPAVAADVSVLPAHLTRNRALVIGSVTRFSAIKDPLNLVEAFLRLRRQSAADGRGICLVMIGDGELHRRARERLEQEGAADSVWLPGNRDDVPALLRSFDIFVLGSLKEGISNTVLEAMATGLPVIATDTGGNRELISSGENGTLVPPGDPNALASALCAYVKDQRLARFHGERARRAAVSRFSIGGMVESYQGLYADALQGVEGSAERLSS